MNKIATKTIAFLLVVLTFSSYFVGIYANSKIICEPFSIPEQENYFYIDSEDNTFSYQGKIIIYQKDELPSSYTEQFANEEFFNAGLSSIGKFILHNDIGFKRESVNGYEITSSPLVLSEHNFVNGRNNYMGYIVIENKDLIIYIPYEFYFREVLYNNLTYSEVYSQKYQISINDILNNIVTEDQYLINIYS